MAKYSFEIAEIQNAIFAIKGMASEATPEQQQALAASRQVIAEMLEKYNDMGKVALTLAYLELQIKED
ncbi:hypothetical protein [Enterobacter ludwigii]|uniref:hypothetical protein n=1 Tax=Enterobacter ludwigii TaxID=299767 RepID=UPI0013CF528F|nr:hypothetical protein [Enterobacter ludwigii]